MKDVLELVNDQKSMNDMCKLIAEVLKKIENHEKEKKRNIDEA